MEKDQAKQALASTDCGQIADLSTLLQTASENEMYRLLGTSFNGLRQSEADLRLARYGANIIAHEFGPPLAVRFLANFNHLMAWLLWVGGVIGFLAGMPQLGIAIWAVNVINGIFSFWQEYKAERAVEALQQMLPETVRVIRDEREMSLPASYLVPGDVIIISSGDKLSADARLIEASNLEVEQSSLTGESNPVNKDHKSTTKASDEWSEQPNLIFAGTSVLNGTGRAVVYSTGLSSKFGRIAHLTQTLDSTPSPLQIELRRVTRIIAFLAISIGAVMFFSATAVARVDTVTSFIFAMGMIVAFVPEGMLPTVTLSLALSVQRMARRNALVKRLSSVETLGCTTVICTDKTGTLTENEMTVRHLWTDSTNWLVTGTGYSSQGQIVEETSAGRAVITSTALTALLRACCLCNNSKLIEKAEGYHIVGDPMESALLFMGLKANISQRRENEALPRIAELSFDSTRKRMTTIHKSAEGQRAFVKGAPTELLDLCTKILTDSGETPLSESVRATILEKVDSFASEGLRVLGVAMRAIDDGASVFGVDTIERDLVFIGLVAMLDPPRPEVPEAVSKCHKAGIRVIMLTGDYGLTAKTIAHRVGIFTGSRTVVVSGKELDALSEDALSQLLSHEEPIFARVTPEHKLRIVSCLQKMGHVVAVTGDGVNDAPALKKADIGVAMGDKGTDVARESADMILLDDNFASIVNAIEEGRNVYSNIKKFAIYVFTSNMAEAVPFMLMLFSKGLIPLPLTVMQVLSVDLGTDMVPALALGADPPDDRVMTLPPRSRKVPLLNRILMSKALLWYGILEALAGMSCYFFANWRNGWPGVPLAAVGTHAYVVATTMTLAGVVAGQCGAVFCCRSEVDSLFKIGVFSNRLVWLGILVELSLFFAIVYSGTLQTIFHTAPLQPIELAFAFMFAPTIVLIDEVRKLLIRLSQRSG